MIRIPSCPSCRCLHFPENHSRFISPLFSALINTFTIKESVQEKKVLFDKSKMKLKSYPAYGSKYAQIKISSVGIDLPLYYGDNLEILSHGIGQYAGSYFPGEGGTIIIAAHNTYGQFYTLPKVKIGDEVIIKTTYGTYTYKITKTEIANADKLGENLHIYTDKETIMLYTCYPVETPGYKSNRFVAYGDLVGEADE